MKPNKSKVLNNLIVLEGMDGAGKTTQANLLKEKFLSFGRDVVIVKASNNKRKQAIENFLNDIKANKFSIEIMFAYQALFSKQCEEAINAINEGKLVIADRWDASFWTFHLNFGKLSEEPLTTLETLNELAFRNVNPKLYFFINVPVETGIRRCKKKKKNQGTYFKDPTFNKKNIDFYNTIVKTYRHLSKERDWIVIDGDKSIKSVHEEILKAVRKNIDI